VKLFFPYNIQGSGGCFYKN